MKMFEDNKGRKWSIEITYGLCRRVQAEMEGQGINLLEPLLSRFADPQKPMPAPSLHAAEISVFVELQTDLMLFFDLLSVILRPQLEASDVEMDGEDGFGCAMAGDHLFSAQQAFFEDWADFFRKLHRSEIVEAMEKTAIWWTKMVESMKAQVSNPEIEKRMTAKLDAAMKSASGKLLESLESIPTD